MIHYKTKEEIKIMVDAGKMLREVVQELMPEIKEGVSTNEIDKRAGELIEKVGGTASFKTVHEYFWNICIPINEQIVHTPPSERVMKAGDMVTLDIGLVHKGYHVDYADTVLIGDNDEQKVRFLQKGKQTLQKAIERVQVGHHLGEVSQFIQQEIEGAGYHIVKELTGHGVGRSLHEEPYVLNYLDRPVEKTLEIKPGLTIAVEVIYAMGTEKMMYEPREDWSIITKDRSLSACFEHSVAITDENTIILT